jgi:hypothetical protein
MLSSNMLLLNLILLMDLTFFNPHGCYQQSLNPPQKKAQHTNAPNAESGGTKRRGAAGPQPGAVIASQQRLAVFPLRAHDEQPEHPRRQARP